MHSSLAIFYTPLWSIFSFRRLPGASEEEIKKAYRQLAKKWHPDQYINTPQYETAMEKMKEINMAYDALTGKNVNPQFGGQGGYGGGYTGWGMRYTPRAKRRA